MVALTSKEKSQKHRDSMTEEEKELIREKGRKRSAKNRALKRYVPL